jgi:hypothetical protein
MAITLYGSKSNIIQTLSASTSTLTSTTSSSYSDVSGLSVTITPSSSTSKILIVASISLSTSTNNAITAGIRIDRSGTAVFTNGGCAYIGIGTPLFYTEQASFSYLDSPATTSSITYKIQFARLSYAGSYGGTCAVNNLGAETSTITVFEVIQ